MRRWLRARRPPRCEAAGRRTAKRYSFTVMGTTDLHGNVFNWDYFTDKEFDDKAHNDVGLAKISTLVNQIREEKGRRNTLLIDAGDTIQGTQLSYYYAKVDPITAKGGPVHPMAQAMNAIGLRRGGAGQPRVQLRHSGAAEVPGAVSISRCWARTRWMRRRCVPAFPPYSMHRLRDAARAGCEGGGAGSDEPGYRDLGQGQCAGEDDVPGAGGAGGEVGAEAAVDGRGRRHRVGAQRVLGHVFVR